MDKRMILYIVIGIAILGLLYITLFPGNIQAWRDSRESIEDKCSPELGYTEESWREHMSHHPNIYKECLR